jgi:hypothetical protein
MKKYVLPHPVLLIGQIICLLVCGIFFLGLYETIFNYENIGSIGIIACAIFFFDIVFFYATGLWQQTFGILKITDEYILHFGLFLPVVKIRFDEIKYMEIRVFDKGNVVYVHNDHSFLYKYILISPNPLPTKRIDKIKPSRRKKLIKYALSMKLCKSIVDKLPERFAKPVEYQIHLNRKAK